MDFRDIVRRTIPRSLRNAMRSPGKTATGMWQDVSYRMMGRSERVNVFPGWDLKCHPSSIPAFDVFRFEPDSREEFKAFVSHASEGMILFDAGAHHGFFGLATAHFGGRSAKAVCVDASEKAIETLNINLHINNAQDQVRTIHAAVGAEPGVLKMVTTGTAGMHYFVGVDGDRPDTTNVQQITIDSLLESTGLTPTHLKIDVEGFEDEALRGSAKILREVRPIVLLELHGTYVRNRGHEPLAVLQRLIDAGYSRFLHNDRPISPQEAAKSNLIRLVILPD